MSTGLTATFQFLAKTENETAVDVLVSGLDCPHKGTQLGALRALLERRSPIGHREVFQRLASMDESCREIVGERPERLVDVVADALQDANPEVCASACRAVTSFRLYESLPALVKVLVDTESQYTQVAAQTILNLAKSFYAELSGTGAEPKHKQQDILRERITTSLEDAVRKYHRHEQRKVVEAFLMVAKPKNAAFRQLLLRPEAAGHQAIVDVLSKSLQGGVLRLLLGFLEDPQMPQVMADVICRRCDAKFVDHFARTVGSRPSKAMASALARFASIAWAQPGHAVFRRLGDAGQEGAVHLLMASSLDRAKVLEVIGYLLLKGRPSGRRAAAVALGQFDGPEASSLVVQALNDEDPQVRAALIVQLRRRGIPGALSMLIRMVDSPHEEVHTALRRAMPEFTLRQFMANFDQMPEETQPVTGHLVRKIDPEVTEKLVAEMNVLSPVRRRLAVSVTGAMGLASDVEDAVVKLLSDDDHMVRVAAAKALADSKSMPVWEALRDALLDRSVIVKEAAEQSLEQISSSLLLNLTQSAEESDAEEQDVLGQHPEEVT